MTCNLPLRSTVATSACQQPDTQALAGQGQSYLGGLVAQCENSLLAMPWLAAVKSQVCSCCVKLVSKARRMPKGRSSLLQTNSLCVIMHIMLERLWSLLEFVQQ